MRDEALYLDDILDAVTSIHTFLENVDKDRLTEDDLLQSAVIHKFTIIGEASSRLSRDLRSRFPQVEWRKIIGTRNIMVHAYFAIDWDLVWATIESDLPVLRKQIAEIRQTEIDRVDSPSDKD